MGWSKLPSDLVISIATWLSDPDDYARFRAVCKSWGSASRGFRPPIFFPWLAVIPGDWNLSKTKLSFITHAGGKEFKCPKPCGQLDWYRSKFGSNNNGWMIFARNYSLAPTIVNPLTGSQLLLPSLHHTMQNQVMSVFLSDNHIAFAECRVKREYSSVLAAAAPGDDKWSFIRLANSYFNCVKSIIFHEADGKFYVMHCKGNMQSFRLTRCGRKTVFGEVSSTLAGTISLWGGCLVSDGTNLLQVIKKRTNGFEILRYCSHTDAWVQVINMDLGNNSLFFDQYGARLLPALPYSQGERKGRPRKNCIYFTECDGIPFGRKNEEDEFVHHVRTYEVGKGTIEPCFSTIIQSSQNFLPALMWFMPTITVNN